MRYRLGRAGDDNAEIGFLRLQALPRRLHVVDAAFAELRGMDQRVDREQIGRVVVDDMALDLVAVFLLRLPVIGPGTRPLELFLVVDERRVLQCVRRARARGNHRPGLVPEVLEVRHLALGELLEQAFLHAQDHLGWGSNPATPKPGPPAEARLLAESPPRGPVGSWVTMPPNFLSNRRLP